MGTMRAWRFLLKKAGLLDSLIVTNVTERPGRALASMAGIAVSIVLIVVTVGLARGMLRSAGERQGAVGAEILFQAPGSFGPGVTAAPLALPVAYATAIEGLQGVRSATPVGRYVQSGGGGLGFELIEGVVFETTSEDYATYPQITGIRIAAGRVPKADDEVIVDRIRAEQQHTDLGAHLFILGREFTVVGIYEPEVGARIKMRLETMQSMLGAAGKASWVLVKCESPAIQETVAMRIEDRFPGNQIIFTRDIPGFFEKGIPSLSVFLDVVVMLAMAISTLIILLAMYTAVNERTREIGILKSLGASRGFIIGVIEREALFLSFLGVLLGFVFAALTRFAILRFTTLSVDIELEWLGWSAAAALCAGAVGALYPALRAANQDPVRALAHE
jgi:putative ABC transport system permease protein